jgi:hypothetical protein
LAATSESASTVSQVNKILPVPSGLIGRPIMVADENEEYLGLIKRLFQIEGDIPLMGIPYIVRRNEL